MEKHTQLPWKLGQYHKSVIIGQDDYCLATTSGPEQEANAAHIVTCVNAHDALVEALKTLLRDEKLDDDSPALIATRNKVSRLLSSLEKGG